jgi:hypothetical protein
VILDFNGNIYVGGDGIYFNADDPIPAIFVVVDCVNGIVYYQALPTATPKGQVSYSVIDCVNHIIYFNTTTASCEYDGRFSGTCLSPPRTSNASYNGRFSGVVVLTFYSELQYNGIFSGIVNVSRPSYCEYDGTFSGTCISVSGALCDYDGIFNGTVIPPGFVASEMCISGPGNPVQVEIANLMF